MRLLRRGALVLALAPLGLVVVFAFTIVYDPWRGRLAMFAVGLACAVWGWTIRIRWLSVGVAGLCITTVVLSLVHSYTKPSGLGLLEPSISRSVWHRDRIDTLTVIRDYDGTPALLRAVEDDVPPDAVLAVAAPIDTFLAPLAGPRLSRTLRLVPHGEHVPRDAMWLVSKGQGAASGCKAAWSTVYANAESHWRLLRRTAPDACGAGRDAALTREPARRRPIGPRSEDTARATSAARIDSSSSSARTSGRPSRSSSTYGGRPPSAGDFATRSPSREHVSCRKRPRRDELLPHLRERRLLARERPLDAVADRGGDTVEIADELPHPLRHEGERVIGALRRVARREVLLDHARAEHVRDGRHRDAVLVVGQADDQLRVALAVRGDDAELELLDGGRVGRGALQQAELRD